jgi:methyl-accepting chemotaxis protein
VPTLKRTRTPQQQAQKAAKSGGGGGGGGGGGRPSTAGGAGVQGTNLIILVLVAVSVIIAAGLLAKTVNTARSIDGKAKSIRTTGTGINNSTDSIVQLVKTNAIARSILRTATPLQPALAKIVNRATSINRSAASIDSLAGTILSTAGTINNSATTINGTAGAINSVAGTINGTAGAINQVAGGINQVAGTINSTAKTINTTAGPGAGILGIARLIDSDASKIVNGLATTVTVATQIHVDSDNILDVAQQILDTAACIDEKLPGTDAAAGQCNNKQP